MRLLVSCIPYDGGKSGISVYTREVVGELAAQGHELTLLCEPPARKEANVKCKMENGELDGGASAIIHSPFYTLHSPILSMLWHLFVLPFWIWRRRRDFDGFVICAANRRVCAWYPIPTTATVHDLANFHIPGKYSRLRMFYLAHILPHYAKKAHRLVAVSGATKADMVKFWHCREADVTVLYNGLVVNRLSGLVVNRLSGLVVKRLGGEVVNHPTTIPPNHPTTIPPNHPTTIPPNHLTTIPLNHQTTQPPNHPTTQPPNHQTTILYISRIEHPGKNHVRLIEAYGRLPREVAEKHPLVIAGADWKDAEVVHEAAAKSPHADLIRFTGFVENANMPRLWAEAGFYVFPSLFEGFGLSLAEAMARGVPCACSNNGSLGEIAGDVAITFDPESVDDIAAALKTLLGESEADREARIARGREWVKRFSWSDHAKGIAKLIEEARGHEGRESREGQEGSCLSRLSRPSRQETTSLFGIPVARVTESEAVERIVELAKRRHSTADIRQPGDVRHSTADNEVRAAFVATLNVDFVANAVSGWPFGGNDELWGYLKNADFVTADGMPIVLLSKLLRRPLPERVTGADMVPAICRRCAEEGLSVYVLGGDRDAIEEAFEKLGCRHSTTDDRHPDVDCRMSNVKNQPLLVAGIDDSFVKLDREQPEIVERINAAKPDILFVALGNPKQELWMGRNASKLDVGVMIGIGGTFNFIAGRVKRAPKWVQKSGLEWIYRIIQEPGRLWKRYAYGLVKFSWLSARALAGGYR